MSLPASLGGFFIWLKVDHAEIYFLLATSQYMEDFELMFSSILLTRQSICCAAAALIVIPSVSAASEEEMAAQIAALEKRLAQLESRLSVNEKKTKEAKVLATNTNTAVRSGAGNNATLNILSNNAWRNLRWTEEDQWKTVVNGASIAQVEDALGKPPRTVKSLKPRIDLVYFYEASIGDKYGLNGKVSFKKGKVVSVVKPDFSKNLSGN